MNPKKSFKGLVVSQTRLRLLKEFFDFPKEAFYLRELARITKEKINSVRRELINLEQIGILSSERRGNRVFYFVNKNHPFFYPLLVITAKSFGLGLELQRQKARLGKIRLVFFSKRFLSWESNGNEVDLLVVGRVVLPEIGSLIVKEEKKRGREINYAVMGWEEFKLRVTNRDPFIIDFLIRGPAIIIGDEEDIFSI